MIFRRNLKVGFIQAMVERKTSYLKQIKNWIVVISSIAMMINVYLSEDFISILLSSFTYISSQGLTFYALNPNTDSGRSRRDWLIKISIGLIAVIIACLTVESKIELNSLIVLSAFNIMKLCIVVFSIFVIYCSFIDGTEETTTAEKELSQTVQKNLKEDYQKQREENIFSERNSRTQNNKETRKFVLGKKRETEETK